MSRRVSPPTAVANTWPDEVEEEEDDDEEDEDDEAGQNSTSANSRSLTVAAPRSSHHATSGRNWGQATASNANPPYFYGNPQYPTQPHGSVFQQHAGPGSMAQLVYAPDNRQYHSHQHNHHADSSVLQKLRDELAMKDDSIASLRSSLDEGKKNTEKANKGWHDSNTWGHSLNTEIKARDTTIADLTTQLEELKAKVARRDAKITQLEADRDVARNAYWDLKPRYNALERTAKKQAS